MLQLGRDKVYCLIRTGQLRSIKIIRLRRITEQHLAEFIASLEMLREPRAARPWAKLLMLLDVSGHASTASAGRDRRAGAPPHCPWNMARNLRLHVLAFLYVTPPIRHSFS